MMGAEVYGKGLSERGICTWDITKVWNVLELVSQRRSLCGWMMGMDVFVCTGSCVFRDLRMKYWLYTNLLPIPYLPSSVLNSHSLQHRSQRSAIRISNLPPTRALSRRICLAKVEGICKWIQVSMLDHLGMLITFDAIWCWAINITSQQISLSYLSSTAKARRYKYAVATNDRPVGLSRLCPPQKTGRLTHRKFIQDWPRSTEFTIRTVVFRGKRRREGNTFRLSSSQAHSSSCPSCSTWLTSHSVRLLDKSPVPCKYCNAGLYRPILARI
jgi:hypothetical protein